MTPRNEIDTDLLNKLSNLREIPSRNPEKEKIGLSAFLQESQELAKAITPNQKLRHNRWMHAIQTVFIAKQKEHSPMLNALATILILLSLALGGSGITVAAAQNSLPDQPLYSVKLFSEDIRQELMAATSKNESQLALEFTERRSFEIKTMLENGKVPSQAVQTRYQSQIDQAIQYALNLPDDQAVKVLAQIQTLLQNQEQTMVRVQTNGSPDNNAFLLQTRQMLTQRLQLIAAGLIDPSQIRDQLRLQDRQQIQLRERTSTLEMPASKDPLGTKEGNPWTTGTPTPGSAYGPGKGTGDCASCTPITDGKDGNPWTTGTPTPGSSYGPGPGPDPSKTLTPGSIIEPKPQPTPNQNFQPTQSETRATQQQNNLPTQTRPQATQGSQPTSSGPGSQVTTAPAGPGKKP